MVPISSRPRRQNPARKPPRGNAAVGHCEVEPVHPMLQLIFSSRTSMIEPAPGDARSRKKALEGPKPMKYMDADGNPVKERPSSTTGTGWGEISSSDDDSDSEP